MEEQNASAAAQELKERTVRLLDDLEEVDAQIQAHRLKLERLQVAIRAYIEQVQKVLSNDRF